jgi:PAS domain S-box-containing protein
MSASLPATIPKTEPPNHPERKQAKVGSRETGQQYRLLFEANPNPMFVFAEDDLRLLAVNHAMMKQYGWSKEEFRGLKATDLRPEEEIPHFKVAIDGQKGSHAALVGEWRHKRKDGTLFDAEITVSAIGWDSRCARLVLVKDITDRKAAEAALRASEQRFRSLIENAADITTILDARGAIIYESPNMDRVLGYQIGTLLGSDGFKLLHPDDHANSKMLFAECLSQPGNSRRTEVRLRRFDGSWRWMEIVGTNLLGDPAVRGIVLNSQDITDRKQAEAFLKDLNVTLEKCVTERTRALHESESRFRAIVGSAGEGIIAMNRRGRIDSINPAALKIFGHAPEELLGRNFSRLIISPQPAGRASLLAQLLSTNRKLLVGQPPEVLGRRKDGSSINLEIALAEFTLAGQPCVVALVHDITERKRLEREILNVGERERQQVGHELHDDLGQILHGLHFLADELQSRLNKKGIPEAAELEKVSQYLDQALERTRSLARGLQPVVPAPEGLMNALREHAARVRNLYGIRCRFICPKPVRLHDPTVATHLFRIAQEAVNNAVKHAACQRILIRLKETPDRLVLAVQDDGHGRFPKGGQRSGIGLHVMQFRSAAIRGSLAIQRRHRGGTEVVCSVPFH